MNKKEWILKEATELRCETSGSDYLVVKILDGCGEIFGAEMANNIEYCFYERNIAIFSWYGCRLETYGVCQTIYISEDTPMSVYVNAHAQLELRRDVALSNNDAGPRVLIMGPSDHGKSSVSKILCNYALRLDRNPIYVDLDVSSGLLSHVPGCLTAIPLDRSCITVEDSFTTPTTSNSPLLAHYYGHTAPPKDNYTPFQMLSSALSTSVLARQSRDTASNASGLFINTCGWMADMCLSGSAEGKLFYETLISDFSIDLIFILGSDRLYSCLSSWADATIAKDNGNSPVLIKLPKSGGTVTRDSAVRRRVRKSQIHEYFYGRPYFPPGVNLGLPMELAEKNIAYSPSRIEVQLSSLYFYRINASSEGASVTTQLTQSSVGISDGMKAVGEVIQSSVESAEASVALGPLVSVAPSQELLHSVLALLHPHASSNAAGNGDEAWLTANAVGFIHVVELDMDRDRLVCLSPGPATAISDTGVGALPSRHLMVGTIKWME